MSRHLLQAIPFLKACQPTIAQLEPFIFGNSFQVCKCNPLLFKDFPCKQNSICHCLGNPEFHHFRNLWVFHLLSLFGCPVTFMIALFPLPMPLGLVLNPGRYQWLLYVNIWIEGSKVLSCCTLVSVILVIPVENFDSLFQGRILFQSCLQMSRIHP